MARITLTYQCGCQEVDLMPGRNAGRRQKAAQQQDCWRCQRDQETLEAKRASARMGLPKLTGAPIRETTLVERTRWKILGETRELMEGRQVRGGRLEDPEDIRRVQRIHDHMLEQTSVAWWAEQGAICRNNSLFGSPDAVLERIQRELEEARQDEPD